MKRLCQFLAVIFAITTTLSVAAESSTITDATSAVLAAKRYTKASCNAVTPCIYKAQREGKQWRVRVTLTKRHSPRDPARPYAGGELFLYFDTSGNLIRKINAE